MKYNSIRMELTGLCDFWCLYCHAGKRNTKDYSNQQLSCERMLALIDEAKELGVTNFILTGGEPFLNPYWNKIAARCGMDARVVISTNGNHFSDENLEKLKDLPQLREFRTSLDGMKTNDIIREGSDYQKSIKAIEKLKRVIPDSKVMIQSVLYEQNISEIMPLYEILKELGINRWRLSQLWKTTRTEKNKHILSFSEYNLMFDLYKEVIKCFQQDDFPFRLGIDNVYDSFIMKEDYISMDLNSHPCLYQFDYLCVNANGDIIFCPALNVPLANCKEKTIENVIENSKWLADFKEITISSLRCNNCRYIRICGGGCRADALKWLNDLRAIDLNSCCMITKVEEEIIPLLTVDEQNAYKGLIVDDGHYPRIKGKNIEEVVINYRRGV